MLQKEIQTKLFQWQDLKYRSFQIKLIPNLAPTTIIGVRTPQLKTYAKKLAEHPQLSAFLHHLPHQYFEENQLHAFIISLDKNFHHCIQATSLFLPYIDNWATCDQFSPSIFTSHRRELLSYIKKWLQSQHPYTVRFALGMLRQHFLDKDFQLEYPQLVTHIKSKEYYVKMMIAWYFATALAKQYPAILPFFTQPHLDTWTHNKALQKANESACISIEQKTYLRSLKIKRFKLNSSS